MLNKLASKCAIMNDTLTAQQMADIGRQLGDALHMNRDREHRDRWTTAWGTKTDIGLYLTLRDQISLMEREAQS